MYWQLLEMSCVHTIFSFDWWFYYVYSAEYYCHDVGNNASLAPSASKVFVKYVSIFQLKKKGWAVLFPSPLG